MRHLIFLFADHFEPRSAESVAAWKRGYPEVAKAFTDSGGRNPRHTWFYDGEDPAVLDSLGALCRMGLGEIEVHLHHSRDTADGLREKLERRKAAYARSGALVTVGPEPVAAFGFVHGKWSLDNSRGDEHCGVNNELAVLRQANCYADFTFPAWGRMQPRKCNSIYYAAGDPARPKSYDTGEDVRAGGKPSGDLMIFQGPGRLSGVPRPAGWVPALPWIADRLRLTCSMEAHMPPRPRRVDRWVAANVSVVGRPEWVFVKVHMHGARPQNFSAYFNSGLQQLHSHLAKRYKDETAWRLHYVTAREAYNIVKAAEAGKAGDPNTYRDFAIAPYRNTR
ncbi:MAG: hypothetical protein ACLQVA_16445 [Candidatus Brocadiia bacterium]